MSGRSRQVGNKARKSRENRKPLKRLPRLEALERRIVLANAIPATTLSLPSQALIGSTVDFNVDFSNASPTQTGYGPFVHLEMPGDRDRRK